MQEHTIAELKQIVRSAEEECLTKAIDALEHTLTPIDANKLEFVTGRRMSRHQILCNLHNLAKPSTAWLATPDKKASRFDFIANYPKELKVTKVETVKKYAEINDEGQLIGGEVITRIKQSSLYSLKSYEPEECSGECDECCSPCYEADDEF